MASRGWVEEVDGSSFGYVSTDRLMGMNGSKFYSMKVLRVLSALEVRIVVPSGDL